MNRILYDILYTTLFLHALLPFRVLYILSDILYFLVYKIIGYRVKVVRNNLKNSFPEKDEQELRTIEKEFYHHFCDYFVETIKLLHITDEEMRKRMQFIDVELIKKLMADGNSVMMFLGHYGNWEWVPSITMDFRDDPNKILGQIYKPLKNKAVDDLFLKIRGRFGSLGIPRYETLRAIVKLRKENKQTLIGFMADQMPSLNNIHYWTTFLNQESAVFTGVERIAKQTGFSVIYLDIEKVKRGHYKATIKLISDTPKSEPGNYITDAYIKAIEKTILRNPAYWLWTHKRWKRSRQEIETMQRQQHNRK